MFNIRESEWYEDASEFLAAWFVPIVAVGSYFLGALCFPMFWVMFRSMVESMRYIVADASRTPS